MFPFLYNPLSLQWCHIYVITLQGLDKTTEFHLHTYFSSQDLIRGGDKVLTHIMKKTVIHSGSDRKEDGIRTGGLRDELGVGG